MLLASLTRDVEMQRGMQYDYVCHILIGAATILTILFYLLINDCWFLIYFRVRPWGMRCAEYFALGHAYVQGERDNFVEISLSLF